MEDIKDIMELDINKASRINGAYTDPTGHKHCDCPDYCDCGCAPADPEGAQAGFALGMTMAHWE